MFFVGVAEPIQVRKEILGCTKDVIGTLKRFEKFKALRREKAETVARLKTLFDEIALLSNKLRQLMPKTRLRALAKETEVGVFAGQERRMRKHAGTDLDKLEQQLAELENKLQRLK